MVSVYSFLAFTSKSAKAAEWSVTTDKADAPKDVAAAIRDALDHTRLTVKNGDAVVAEFWLRSDLPSGANADQVRNGLGLKDIPETTVLGAVRFEKAFTDYRKQAIPAGVYVMRLVLQPETGDHKDTAPHSTFALLTPSEKDRDADTLDVKDVVRLSRAATGADHPAVLLLYPAKKAIAEPRITTPADGVSVLEVKRSVTASGDPASVGFSIVVHGVSKSR